jgi:glycosyltransferase involved in cell wall biosynthesis
MMNENIELSVVVLCYGAQESIIAFAEKLKSEISRSTNSFEIILVGNYMNNSSDRTPEIIQDLAEKDSTYKAISKQKEGMMGWDVRIGLSEAKGDYICFIDGDGQFPISSITECFTKIKGSDYGLVKTYRSKRGDGFQRAITSFGYNLIFKVLFPKVNAKDINSKPKIFTREVYEKLDLSYDDWFIDAEIMIKVSQLGVKFYEFPIEFLKLEGRTSFVNLSTVFEFVRNLFNYRFKKK